MTSLLDVNVLVALAWPNHVHHAAATRWFEKHASSGWGTCPVSQAGFVRVSSNVRVTPHAVSPADAMALLAEMTALPGHAFLDDDTSFVTSPHLERQRVATYRQVTDAHLLAVATRHDGRLVTFDHGIDALVPPGQARRVLVLRGGS